MWIFRSISLQAILLARFTITARALIAPDPVSKLLRVHASSIQNLKEQCQKQVGDDAMSSLPYSNDIFFLRYCLASEEASEQQDRLLSTLEWRTGSGKSICEAATTAYELATSEGGWKNEPVVAAAPHSSIISKYLTPSNVITTTSSQNDLVYCIRAGQIDDTALMSEVSIDQMADFFLYAKEMNALVVNERSIATDSLQCVVTANDLAGVKLVGGSAEFRKALSASSNQANALYPSTNGPTLLLNLPKLLSALVKLFTPLFPPEVKARLKFEQGPLSDVTDLRQIASSASGPERSKFVQQLDNMVYSQL